MNTNALLSFSSCLVFIVIITVLVLFFFTNVFGNNTPLPPSPPITPVVAPAVEAPLVCSGSNGAYIFNHGDTLFKENALEECHGIVSIDGQSQLVMEETGKVVMYKNKQEIWSISAKGSQPYKLLFDSTGDLKLSSSGNTEWSSETGEKGVTSVVLENSGHLVFYKDSKEIVKTIPDLSVCVGPEATYIPRLDHLVPGQILNKCEALVSDDKNIILAMQSDGYMKIFNVTDKKELWSSIGPKEGDPVSANLVLQNDGNAVIYNNTAPIWSSNTVGQKIKLFKIQSDGNLVLYNETDKSVWASNSLK